MKFVEPIRDAKKITQIKNTLRGEGNARDYLLFSAGINFGLRISDLLGLRVSDVFDTKGNIKESFELVEMKTKKRNQIGISPKIQEALQWYAEIYPRVVENQECYLFFAKKKFPQGSSHIGRNQAWVLIHTWCRDAGLNGSYSGHSLRKTLGYHSLRNNIPIELISARFNHSDAKITSRYLGITKDETMKAFMALDL